MQIERLELAQRIAHDVAKFHKVSKRLREVAKWTPEEVLADASTAAWHALEAFDESKGVPVEKWVVQAVTWRLVDQLRAWTHHKRGRNQAKQLLAVDFEEGQLPEPMEQQDSARFARSLNAAPNFDELEEALDTIAEACKQGVAIMRRARGRRRMTEEKIIRSVLHYTGGHRAEAARIMGMNRPHLYAKLRDHGLTDEVPTPACDRSPGASRSSEKRLLLGILRYFNGSAAEAARATGLDKVTVYNRCKVHGIEVGRGAK